MNKNIKISILLFMFIVFIFNKNKNKDKNKDSEEKYKIIKNFDYHLKAEKSDSKEITNKLQYYKYAPVYLIVTGTEKSLLTSKSGKKYELPESWWKLYEPDFYTKKEIKFVDKTSKWKLYGDNTGDIMRDSRLTYDITMEELNKIAVEYLENAPEGEYIAVTSYIPKEFYKAAPLILIKGYIKESFLQATGPGFDIVYLSKGNIKL